MVAVNSFSLLATLLILSQILTGKTVKSDVNFQECNFASKSQLLKDGKILFCHKVFTEGTIIEVTCPREINGVPYSFYPEDPTNVTLLPSHSFGKRESTNFRMEEWPISQIFGRLSNQPLVYWKDESKRTLVIKYPDDGYLVRRHFSDIIYLCKPTDLELTPDSMAGLGYSSQVHFDDSRTDDGSMIQSDALDFSDLHGIALFELNIANIPKVTHGCGNVPSNLFLNKSFNDPIDPLDTCTLDVMETPNIGFYCDGIVEPKGCFDKVLRTSSSSGNYHDLVPSERKMGNLYYRNFRKDFFMKDFAFKSYCRDPTTKNILATMTVIRVKHHHVSIPALIPKHLIQPSRRDWYRMTLYPGDSIKITFPKITGTYNVDNDEYKNFEGIRGPCVSAMIPTDPTSSVLERTRDEFNYYENIEPIHSLFLKESLNVKYNKTLETLLIEYLRAPMHGKYITVTYIWKYICPPYLPRSLTASVVVTFTPYVSHTLKQFTDVPGTNGSSIEEEPV